MEVNVKQKTEDTVLELYAKAEKLDPGSKEHEAIITAIEKLLRQLNEDDKINLDNAMQYDKLNQEKLIAEQKAKEEKKGRIFGYVIDGLTVGTSIASLFFFGRWYHEGLAYEKEGIISSNWTRQLTNKITQVTKRINK